MPSNPIAQQAREHHRLAGTAEADADQHREQRDAAIRRLRLNGWTYTSIAAAVGCSSELVAKIVKAGRT